jgi:hypothetical protein
MTTYPSSDESFARLHAAGWSVGEVRAGSSWIVSGTNGENVLRAERATSAEAWHCACEQAEAMAGEKVRGKPAWPATPTAVSCRT